jgi:hypothetical protein
MGRCYSNDDKTKLQLSLHDSMLQFQVSSVKIASTEDSFEPTNLRSMKHLLKECVLLSKGVTIMKSMSR